MSKGFWSNPWTISILAGLASSAIGWVIIWIWKRAKRGTKQISWMGLLKLLQTLFVVIFILLFTAFVMVLALGPSEASALAKMWSLKAGHAIKPLSGKIGLFFRKHPAIAAFSAGAASALALVVVFLSLRGKRGKKRRK
ncbi:MAG: hypothetical protein ACP5QG_04440 [candidate division WOR-3 bacterium]